MKGFEGPVLRIEKHFESKVSNLLEIESGFGRRVKNIFSNEKFVKIISPF